MRWLHFTILTGLDDGTTFMAYRSVRDEDVVDEYCEFLSLPNILHIVPIMKDGESLPEYNRFMEKLYEEVSNRSPN